MMDFYRILVMSLCLVWKVSGVPDESEDKLLSRKTRSLESLKMSKVYLSQLRSMKPGQRMPPLCAFTRYRCCRDYITPREGKHGISCEIKLCYDKNVGTCYKKKQRRTLDCKEGSDDSKSCPFSCGHCKPPAPPIKKCLARNPPHGCCWDGTDPLGNKERSCRPCRNNYRKPCEIFKNVAGGCSSGSYSIRKFMTENCPVTCGFCAEALKSQRRPRRLHRRLRP